MLNISRAAGLVITLAFGLQSAVAQFSPCLGNQSFKIVVLGSSTAAGSGPSHPDSAWVNRYRRYLKTINASNDVINLALGGTTTYHIMPDSFVPAIAGRPLTDTLRNITKAISLNPDGIIVNMPSNDAARGFSPAEQMFNFDSLVSTATLAGIPIWICTTQPRNGLNATATQWQIDVKDSILAKYGNQAINFWDTFATATGTLEPLYNSGDGIHMNNAGHALLFKRVKDKNILLTLFQATGSADYSIYAINPSNFTICGDSNMTFPVVLTNNGANDTNDVIVHFSRNYINGSTTASYTDTLTGGLNTCSTDTIYFNSTVYAAGEYMINAWLTPPAADTNEINDSLDLTLSILGHPDITVFNDTACHDSTASLVALTTPSDTLMWYEHPNDSLPFQGGTSLFLPPLDSSLVYYVEAVRGPLFYSDSIHTTYASNNDWNGMMFDLVAHDNIVLDSLALKVFTLGKQAVNIYQKPGTFKGHEGNASSWNLYHIDTVDVSVAHSIHRVSLDSLVMNAGDTFGIYLKMQSHLGKLSYMVVSQPVSRKNSELEIITGSSITHNWGGSYYPRDWNGSVYYHFGFNPKGSCQSELTPVHAHMEIPYPSLGADTSIQEDDSLLLFPGNYQTYHWSTGDTTASLLISGKDFGIGTHTIGLEIESKFGCLGNDSIVITIDPADGLSDITGFGKHISLYPNPTSGLLNISSATLLMGSELTIRDHTGRTLHRQQLMSANNKEKEFRLDLSHLPDGFYLVMLNNGIDSFTHKLLIRK